MTLVLPTPTNYDNAYIAVIPANIKTAATAITAAATSISDDLDAIFKCLSELRLSWSGPASNAADEVAGRWMDSVSALFGTSPPAGVSSPSGAGPASGVSSSSGGVVHRNVSSGVGDVVDSSAGALNVLVGALNQIAANYASTEQSASAMFQNVRMQILDSQVTAAEQNLILALGGSVPPAGPATGMVDDGSDAPYYGTSVNES